MPNHYKMTFTEDRENYRTLIVPAKNLVDAYIEIQTRFPQAEITEAIEGNRAGERWSQIIARYMINHASIDDICTFAIYLDEGKHDEFINTIWDEWHKSKRAKAVEK